MKKVAKVFLVVVAVLVALLVAFVVTLPLTIAPVVKTAASVGGPKVLGVPVSVGDVKLSPLAGRLEISKLVVGNPKGFSDKPAFAVDKVDVALNLRSLLGDTIIVKKVHVESPAISYESKDGTTNFDALLANAKKSESEEKAAKPEEKKEKKAGKKVIIEEFKLNGTKVSYSSVVTFGKLVTIPLPAISLKDIGKSSNGATPVEAVTEVMNAIVSGLSKAVMELATTSTNAVKNLLSSVSSKAGTNSVGSALGGAADAATNTVKEAGQAIEGAAKSLKKLFK